MCAGTVVNFLHRLSISAAQQQQAAATPGVRKAISMDSMQELIPEAADGVGSDSDGQVGAVAGRQPSASVGARPDADSGGIRAPVGTSRYEAVS